MLTHSPSLCFSLYGYGSFPSPFRELGDKEQEIKLLSVEFSIEDFFRYANKTMPPKYNALAILTVNVKKVVCLNFSLTL